MRNKTPSPQNTATEFFFDEQWRERFLNVVLRGSCILGFVTIALYLFSSSTLLYKMMASAAYGILILVTVLMQLSYRIRASIFLSLLFFAASAALIDHGVAYASPIFLGFIVMSGLLFSPRIGIYPIVALTIVIILVFGWPRALFEDSTRLTAILLVVSLMIAISLYTFQAEFTKAQKIAQEALEALQEERSTLEKNVDERTTALTRKTEQLRAISYIARETAEVQDLASLLNTVAQLVTDQFGFYHTGIFLVSETGNQVVLQAASSEGGQRMVERGYSLSVETQGAVGFAAAQKKPRIALDAGSDAVFFNNPDLPLTRSEVALPLLIRNKVLGVLDIHSDKSQAFRTDDIEILQTLSDQIAIAIENTRLLDETQAAMLQLEAVTSMRTHEAWDQKLREQERVFTYTPLGLRAEKLAQTNENAISVPILLRGRKIGNISVARKSDGKWSRLDEGLLDEVASQVGLAVDNIRLLEEATQRAKQEQAVGKLAAQFSQSLDLDTLLQTAARELGQLPNVSEVSVIIGQEEERILLPKQQTKRNMV